MLLVPISGREHLLVHVLATALQANGVRVRVLSWSEPAEVTAAVDRLAPAAVLIDVAARDPLPGSLEPVVDAAREGSTKLPLFVHQEGGGPLDLPPSADVHRVRTVPGALHEVLAVV